MTSSALSSRRRYLRRPKVCKSSPNPGRCTPPEEPPPPVVCPPNVLTGFVEMTGTDWCHGANHHWDFSLAREPIPVDPWEYYGWDVGWPPGNYIVIKIWQTPVPKLYAYPQYWDMPWVFCGEAEKDNVPIVWCQHQNIVIGDWDWISPGLSVLLHVDW